MQISSSFSAFKKVLVSLKCVILFAFITFSSTTTYAWIGADITFGLSNGNVHFHGDDVGPYYDDYEGYYRPRVIIERPQRYIRRGCDEMEVCDAYGSCWLEEDCG